MEDDNKRGCQPPSEMRTDYGSGVINPCCLDSNFYETNLASVSVISASSASSNMTLDKGSRDLLLQSEKSSLNPEKYHHRKSKCSTSVRLYRRRFIMLFIFFICSMMNGVPQFQFTVVADIIACYYHVSLNEVNWTSVVYMVAFLPLVFPVMYLMDTKGLRITLIIGGILNLAGSVVQSFSFISDRFTYVLACQSIYAIGQVFVLSLPPFIAGVWFGANEVALACAMGVFGNQLGIAIGFIIPPFILSECHDDRDLAFELSVLAYAQVAANVVILFIILIMFQEKPELFPSVAQASKPPGKPDYGTSLRNLFKDVQFVLLLIAYGLITGAYFTMSTIINEMVLIHFPGDETDAGWMGAIMVFTGMIGSVVLGVLINRTHKYKEISLLVFIVSFFLLVGYTFLIEMEHIWIQYMFFTLLGLFMTGYLPAGFDFGAEITYPEPEAMSGSLLNASTQIFSIIFTNVSSTLLQTYGDFFSNLLLSGALLLGTIFIACMKCNLKRTNAAFEDVKPT